MDWYAPRLALDGAVHLVRVPMAGSGISKLLKARATAEKASAGEGFGEVGAEGPPYLVSAKKSGKSRRGLGGIKSDARKAVLRRSQVMGAFPGAVSFTTVAFSNAQVVLLTAVADGMQIWNKAFTHAMQRKLRLHTDKPLAVYRYEMHPKRSGRMHRPVPHLHALIRTKGKRWDKGAWLTPGDVKDACREAFSVLAKRLGESGCVDTLCSDFMAFGQPWHQVLEEADWPPRVEMQWARDPAAYLAKYVAKNEDGTGGCVFDGYENAVPHQWHGCSKELKAIDDACATRLPPEMAEWLWREGCRLERLGLCKLREWTPPGCESYRITTVYIRTPEAVAQLWELFLFETGYGRWLDPGAPLPPAPDGSLGLASLWA